MPSWTCPKSREARAWRPLSPSAIASRWNACANAPMTSRRVRLGPPRWWTPRFGQRGNPGPAKATGLTENHQPVAEHILANAAALKQCILDRRLDRRGPAFGVTLVADLMDRVVSVVCDAEQPSWEFRLRWNGGSGSGGPKVKVMGAVVPGARAQAGAGRRPAGGGVGAPVGCDADLSTDIA
jgi:hypothetical protein